MDENEKRKEELKAVMHMMRMISANIENWKYVSTNAEYLDKKIVAGALEQVLSITEPYMHSLQSDLEIEALTTLDPQDLI